MQSLKKTNTETKVYEGAQEKPLLKLEGTCESTKRNCQEGSEYKIFTQKLSTN